MPPSQFNAQETEFLLRYLDKWLSIEATRAKNGQVTGRAQLVRDVVADFFEQFPGRDPSIEEGDGPAFDEATVRDMPRVRPLRLHIIFILITQV